MDAREPVRRSFFIAGVSPGRVYDVVVDFAAYPQLFSEIKGARVLSRTPVAGDGAAEVHRVEFRAQVVLPVRYVLDLTCRSEPAETPSVDWRFVEGEIVTDSTGSWRFSPEGGGTAVVYQVALDIRAPLPGFVLRKVTDGLVAASIPNMFTSIEREVRRRAAVSPAGPAK
ncbi:MAG TPA: SRPBCC family protein [Polyangia bacterium]|jgi:ribosome-associated toxin RatA of RatAB toxin-antitoxin module|nr:SRPBCC family protein [Polyangia bacterium]